MHMICLVWSIKTISKITDQNGVKSIWTTFLIWQHGDSKPQLLEVEGAFNLSYAILAVRDFWTYNADSTITTKEKIKVGNGLSEVNILNLSIPMKTNNSTLCQYSHHTICFHKVRRRVLNNQFDPHVSISNSLPAALRKSIVFKISIFWKHKITTCRSFI